MRECYLWIAHCAEIKLATANSSNNENKIIMMMHLNNGRNVDAPRRAFEFLPHFCTNVITFIEKMDKGKQHHDINLLNSSMENQASQFFLLLLLLPWLLLLFASRAHRFFFYSGCSFASVYVRFHVNDIRSGGKKLIIESIFVNRTPCICQTSKRWFCFSTNGEKKE